MAETTTYTGKDIQVLEGLEPVRKRPGMYIGGTGTPGLHHLLWEIVDNAVDEATNGYASQIDVTLHKDGQSITVADDGRGIPVDMHPDKGIPALQVILTTLHAGGKFDGSSYITSGGLHGVGASVVNALSDKMVATVKRDKKEYEQRFQRGTPVTELTVTKDRTRGTGTTIFFRPDADIFETVDFDALQIRETLEVKTYLNRGLKIVFHDEKDGETFEYVHDGGVAEYLGHIVESLQVHPIHEDVFTLEDDDLEGEGRLEISLQWTDAPKEQIRTFVNGIPTQDGGTHEQGLRSAIRSVIRSYMDTHDLVPHRLDVTADDTREGLVAIVNLFHVDPQFQGQTKDKLNNPSVRSLVAGALRRELEQYLNDHPSTGEAIATRVVQAAKARRASRSAASRARGTSKTRRLNLPGKLADCSSSTPQESELFIVEGDSAGGSAKQGRDRGTQAVLPLRGKVLNAHQANTKRVRNNKELSNIVQALGCGLREDFDLSSLRYHKIILLMDADSDGHHIATLLLTFFYNYMPALINGGYIYIAQPPLYRIDAGSDTYWALDDEDKDRIINEVQSDGRNLKTDIQRFKGLGEMMPKTLKETTLDPDKRRLLKVSIPDDMRAVTQKTMDDLMGRDTSARFEFIMQHAAEADELDV